MFLSVGVKLQQIIKKMNRKKILAISIVIMIVIVLFVVAQINEFGCCRSFCFETRENSCPGNWSTSSCDSLQYCTLGCCKDSRNNFHSEYPEGECERKGGRFVAGPCPGVKTCPTVDI